MKKIVNILIIILINIVITGCNQDDNIENNYYSFKDSSNYEVVLKEKPKNVAVLFSSFVEVWNLAGGETKITVGESVSRGFVEKDVILVDSNAGKQINTEILISANPDFVICSMDISAQVKTSELMRNNNIPCALFKIDTFDEYLNFLKICTDITGKNEIYQNYGVDIKENIDEMILSTKNIDGVKNILFIRAGSSSSATKAKGSNDHFACKILKDLKTNNIADEAKILLDGLSIEEVLIRNPDYIFISLMGNEESSRKYINSVINSEIWKELSAVKNGKVYILPKNLFQYKPNHKWDLAYKYIMDIIYEEYE